MQTSNLSTVPDIISVLHDLVTLAHSQVIMPDLETPYSRPSFASTTNHFAVELKNYGISDIINEHQQQLDAALDEISCLQTVIDSIGALRQKLVQKTDMITQSINLHKRLVSALWRMPTEVLSHIFIHCLPDASCPLPTLTQVPMLLTRVCRRWRDVAVGMPGLWCRLSMGKDWQRVASSYALWLKQSQGRPLSLALKCHILGWSKLRRFLQPHINQVSSLFLPDFSWDAGHPEIMIADFPALEELSISMDSIGLFPAVARALSQPPFTLRSLTLTGGWVSCGDFPDFLGWARLTNVEIELHESQAFPRLLHQCPNLSSLTINTAWRGMQDWEPFMHAKLQSLHIFCPCLPPYSYDFSDPFDALSLPNLRVFEAHHIEPWPHYEFNDFLARSNCPLERLVFGDGTMTTDEQRAEYIALIPSLEVVVNHTMHECI